MVIGLVRDAAACEWSSKGEGAGDSLKLQATGGNDEGDIQNRILEVLEFGVPRADGDADCWRLQVGVRLSRRRGQWPGFRLPADVIKAMASCGGGQAAWRSTSWIQISRHQYGSDQGISSLADRRVSWIS